MKACAAQSCEQTELVALKSDWLCAEHFDALLGEYLGVLRRYATVIDQDVQLSVSIGAGRA